jgi:hypothetical protein
MNSANKFVFSAINNAVRTPTGPEPFHALPRGSTALYMSNVDGSELEEVIVIDNCHKSAQKCEKAIGNHLLTG